MPLKPKSNTSEVQRFTTPADQTWRYYSDTMEKFRRLCHSDEAMAQQADARIRAKRVTEEWDRKGRPQVDAFSISRYVDAVILDDEDRRQINALCDRKKAFRDKMCSALGKLPDESWDAFYARNAVKRAIPNTVRQFELMSQS